MTLYTDIDPYCCAVLGSRVEDGSLPPGDVLLADVRDLTAEHLRGYRHVHLFAGIGGMPLGLAWAGWPMERSILTGGFPCPDISVAGRGAGIGTREAPTARSGLFWELIRVLTLVRPSACLVENVGALSRRGLDVVAAALGEAGYVVADALRVGAWAVGAPHERERWWLVGWQRAESDADGCAGGQSAGHDDERGRAGATEQTRLGGGAEPDAGAAGLRAERVGAEPHKPVPVADAACQRKRESNNETCAESRERPRENACGVDSRSDPIRDADHGQGRGDQGRVVAGWADPVDGPWRAGPDGREYAGPPLFVYRAGQRRQERDAAAEPGGARFTPRRPDPTRARGWPVPVLPGYTQHDWEAPRLHQRGVGDAIHGLPGRVAGALNKSGVRALGNAVVPQVVAAVGAGMRAASVT